MEEKQPGQVILPNGPQPSGSPDQDQNQPASDQLNTGVPPAPAGQIPQPPADGNSSFYAPRADDVSMQAPSNAVAPNMDEFTDASTVHGTAEDIHWVGAEFIAHEKNISWFLGLIVASIIFIALVYLLFKDKVTTTIIGVTVIALGIFASRKPRQQEYSLTTSGLEIGTKLYSFHEFKSFSVADEAGMTSIVLMPLKRFMPPLAVYVPAEIEKQAVDYLADILPMEKHRTDAVDSMLRKIRF